jgi:hypothetical protein
MWCFKICSSNHWEMGRIRIRKLRIQIPGSGSVIKPYGSGTLLISQNDVVPVVHSLNLKKKAGNGASAPYCRCGQLCIGPECHVFDRKDFG